MNPEKNKIADSTRRREAYAAYAKAVVCRSLGESMREELLENGRLSLKLYRAMAELCEEDRAVFKELCSYMAEAEYELALAGEPGALGLAREYLSRADGQRAETAELWKKIIELELSD